MTKNRFVAEVTFKGELRKWVSDDNDVIPEFLDMIENVLRKYNVWRMW